MSDFNFSFSDLEDDDDEAGPSANFSSALFKQQDSQGGRLETTRASSDQGSRGFNVFSFSELLQGKAIFGQGSDVLNVVNNYMSGLLGGTLGVGGNEDEKIGGGFDNLVPQDVKDRAKKLKAEGVGKDIGVGGAPVTSTPTDPAAPSPTDPAAPPTGGPAPTGTLQDLAAQIYNHPSITYDYGKAGKIGSQFRILSEGGMPQMGCAGSTPDVRLLGLILGIANRFPIQISSFIRPENGCGGHGMGFCVDIDGTDGSIGISGSDERSNKIVATAIELMDTSYSLGFGRGNRSTPLPAAPPGKRVYDFNDNANHVHIQLKD